MAARSAIQLRTKSYYGIWASAIGTDVAWERLPFFQAEAWRDIVKLIEEKAEERLSGRMVNSVKQAVEPEFRSEPVIKRLRWELSAARAEHNVKLADAAIQSGVSASTLRRIEAGRSANCGGLTLMKICAWASTLGYTEFCGFSITPVKKESPK